MSSMIPDFSRGLDPFTGLPKRGKNSRPGGFQPFGNNENLAVQGFTPDYKSLIQNDPYLSQLRTDLGSFSASDAAQRDALLQGAAIQFGAVPDFNESTKVLGLDPGVLSGIFTPQVREAAQQNTQAGLSTTARLGRAFEKQVADIRAALAARGGLRSGALGVALEDANLQRRQADTDATQQLLQTLREYVAGFAAAERERQQQLAQARLAATERQTALNPATPDRPIENRGGRWVYSDTGEPTQNVSYNDLGETPSPITGPNQGMITGPSVGPYANNPNRPRNVAPPTANELRRMLGIR